jgi:hypothetical protein
MWSNSNVTYIGRVIVGSMCPERPEPPKSLVLCVPKLSPNCPQIAGTVPNGSFALIVVKNTRQVIRIKIMRADLLGWCGVDDGVVFNEVVGFMRI